VAGPMRDESEMQHRGPTAVVDDGWTKKASAGSRPLSYGNTLALLLNET
jgi:hypothetical protein